MNKLLFSHRQNIKRVVDVAEDLLGYRLNRVNNSLLWTHLNRPGTRVSASSLSPAVKEEEVGAGAGASSTPINEDEAQVILKYTHKLRSSKHPLLSYTKQFERGVDTISTSSYQIRSMVVMLVGNMLGFSNNRRGDRDSMESNVGARQKALAEVAETIYTAHMLHRTVVEIPKDQFLPIGKVDEKCASDSGESFEGVGISLHQGNKIATLVGDLLLARCCLALAALQHNRVTEMMSNAIADFSESESIVTDARVLTTTNLGVPDRNSFSKDLGSFLNLELWKRRGNLGIGSLLRNACSGALLLSGRSGEDAALLGHKIGLALQAHKDYMAFEDDFGALPQIDLCSLPVLYQLEINPTLFASGQLHKVYEEIRHSAHAKLKTKQHLIELADDAISHVSRYSCSSSKILQEFLTTLSS